MLERGLARFILAVGVLAWLAVQGVLVGVPLRERSAPPEADDAYVYILKSVQMASCFFQDCPALEDLRGPLKAPAPSVEGTWQRYRAYTRCFLVYHPLYSAVLLALHSAGASWEQAYKLIWASGPLLFGLAFAYWLTVFWGAAQAGFALLWLSVQVFPGQGLHYVTPTNLSLALAAVYWGRIAAARGTAPWTIPIGATALVAMHPTGRIYAVAGVVLSLLLAGRPKNLRAAAPQLLAFGVALLPTILARVLSRPEMSIASEAMPSLRHAFVLPYFTLEKVVEAFDRWSLPLGSLPVMVVLVAAGFALAAAERRRALSRMALVLCALLAASLLHVMPRYPAELFARLWVPFAVFMTGALGELAWQGLQTSARLLAHAAGRSREAPRLGSWKPDAHQSLALGLLLPGVLAALGAKAIVHGCGVMRTTLVYMRDRQAVTLSPEQPRLLLAQARKGDRVLYLNEIPMYFYFAHGALDHGAAFQPALAGTPEEAGIATSRFAVAFGPARMAPSTPRGLVRLVGSRSMDIEIPAGSTGRVGLRLTNPGGAVRLRVEGRSTDVPAASSGWVWTSVPKGVRRVRVELPEGDAELSLGGLSLGDERLSWPWREKAKVVLVPRDVAAKRLRMDFDVDALLPPAVSGGAEVLDDQGSTILIRLRPAAPKA